MRLHRTTPEQRANIYGDVRELIMPGFLAHPVSINGARFVLRTLDASEWHLLRYRTHGAKIQEFKAWAIAVSIWMVEGVVVSSDEDNLYDLSQLCLSLPTSILEDLFGILGGLRRRMSTAAERAEAFCYESESRNLWRSEGGSFFNPSNHRGGSRPRNPIATLWVYFNQAEDEWEEKTYAWDLAKFIAGPHVPKGIKKLDSKDKKHAADLRDRRQRIMDRVYYEAKGIVRKQKDLPLQRKGTFLEYREAHTEEELQDEMKRWVAGIKDEHDLVIDDVKARIKYERETRKQQEMERQAALASALEEEGITKSQLVPLVGEAGQKFLERMRSRLPGSKVMTDNTHNRAYEKYIKNNPEVGNLRVTDDGRLVQSGGTPDPRLFELLRQPEPGEDPSSLQQRVQSRRPTASFEDDEG